MKTLEELTELANQSLDVVKGYDPDREESASDDISAGEPVMAIEGMLQIAYAHPELFPRFPQGVRDLSDDEDCFELWPYSDKLHNR